MCSQEWTLVDRAAKCFLSHSMKHLLRIRSDRPDLIEPKTKFLPGSVDLKDCVCRSHSRRYRLLHFKVKNRF